LCLLGAATADAHTWYVKPDETGNASTIQACIDSAAANDSILSAPGTYDENLDTKGKGLALLGTSMAEATIIDGGQRGRVLSGRTRVPAYELLALAPASFETTSSRTISPDSSRRTVAEGGGIW